MKEVKSNRAWREECEALRNQVADYKAACEQKQEIIYGLMKQVEGVEVRVKPAPMLVQRRFFWATMEGRGLVLTEIHHTVDGEAIYSNFHSHAIPTVGKDGTLTFEVPE